jgi:hypothetical protein
MFDQRREDAMVTILFVVVLRENHSTLKMLFVYLENGYLLANREMPEISWAEDFCHASA